MSYFKNHRHLCSMDFLSNLRKRDTCSPRQLPCYVSRRISASNGNVRREELDLILIMNTMPFQLASQPHFEGQYQRAQSHSCIPTFGAPCYPTPSPESHPFNGNIFCTSSLLLDVIIIHRINNFWSYNKVILKIKDIIYWLNKIHQMYSKFHPSVLLRTFRP